MVFEAAEVEAYAFERNFDDSYWVEWMQLTGVKVAFAASVLYVLLIFGFQWFMTTRERLKFQRALVLWNLALAVFSAIGSWRMIVALINVLHHGTWHDAICDSSHYSNVVSGYWLWACTMSKIIELGDTVFVVSRKSKLIFLHWYHHVATLLNVWWGYSGRISTAFLFTVMNLTIHAMMYSYYALRAAGVRVPKPCAMVITALQLSQMFIGVWLCYYVYQVQSQGEECHVSLLQWRLSGLMYLSYFVLFANFFYNTYMKGRQGTRRSDAKQE
uniref:Elongation of very long chain fatty acids protein n=1 Tax=Saccoglossus kowalevskii TaxID=10224 RepID=A0ABM0GII8_SACKO|nr:PREDICTED: elongation of very long chain fatty acids protein 6-like [Saccoglossus kowalevskii]